MRPELQSEAYKAGARAFADGHPPSSNPYGQPLRRHAQEWTIGWESACLEHLELEEIARRGFRGIQIVMPPAVVDEPFRASMISRRAGWTKKGRQALGSAAP